MSHFTVGVLIPEDTPLTEEFVEAAVGMRIDAYDENKSVDPYKVHMTPEDIERMATHYGIDKADTDSLLTKMDDWHGREGGVDEQGMFYWSTYNPKSKWDWFQIGGRWPGKLYPDAVTYPRDSLGGNVRKVSELPSDLTLWALVTDDGEWHESGRMGWWGMSSDDKDPDKWDAERSELLSAHRDHLLVVVDCHI